MTRNISTFRSIVTRCLAAGVLLCVYCIGIVGTSVSASSAPRRWCWRRRAPRLMPEAAAVAEVAAAEEAVFAAAVFAAVASAVAASVAVAAAGGGAAT